MNDIFADIGYLLLLINMVFYLKGFSNNGRAFKSFVYYLIVIFIIQIVSSVYQYFEVNNLFISHFYFLSQFFILRIFYYFLVKDKLQKKIIRITFSLCLLSLLIQYFISPTIFFGFNLYEVFITSFLLIIYSTFHLYNQLDSKKEFYYINLGILIYLFGSTILFLVGNLMLKFDSKYNKIPWILNSLLYIVYQLFILYEWKVSFLNNKKKSL
ncbi:YhhN-like protein [Flavobacterium jumunjinense]